MKIIVITNHADRFNDVGPEIAYGEEALKLAGQCARNFGATRVQLVSDAGVAAAGWTTWVADSLAATNAAAMIFDAVAPKPRTTF